MHSQQSATLPHPELPLTTRKDTVIKYSNCTTYTTSVGAALYVTADISHLVPFLPSSQSSTEHFQIGPLPTTLFQTKNTTDQQREEIVSQIIFSHKYIVPPIS